jgi:hypothetical protein
MNERIEYLALLARQHAGELHPNSLDIENWAKVYHEKFAELIVRQCAEIADTAEPFLASDLIKQHFGVKE